MSESWRVTCVGTRLGTGNLNKVTDLLYRHFVEQHQATPLTVWSPHDASLVHVHQVVGGEGGVGLQPTLRLVMPDEMAMGFTLKKDLVSALQHRNIRVQTEGGS